MKKKAKFWAAVLCAGLLCGCGNGVSVETSEALKEQTEAPESRTESEKLSEEPEKEQETPEEPVILSGEEITFFTRFIQERENYGFLLSEYDGPEDVDLEQVLYSGAGFGEGIPEEDIPLYLAAAGQEYLETDCLKFPVQSVEEFVQRKLGIGFKDVKKPLEWWIYVTETDSYYHEAGDTNFTLFSCVGGIRNGDTYTLRFTPESDWTEWMEDRETILVKGENGYRFLSNHFLTDSKTEGAEKQAAGKLPFETPLELSFSSGAGAWGTGITLKPDGFFEGGYDDSNMGDSGEEYPYGTHYTCSFSGQFFDIKQVNEYTYSMTLGELFSEKTAETQWIEEGVLYIAAEPYGIAGGKEFLLYTPKTPLDQLSEEFLMWWPGQWMNDETQETLSCYGLYNREGGYGFFTFD